MVGVQQVRVVLMDWRRQLLDGLTACFQDLVGQEEQVFENHHLQEFLMISFFQNQMNVWVVCVERIFVSEE